MSKKKQFQFLQFNIQFSCSVYYNIIIYIHEKMQKTAKVLSIIIGITKEVPLRLNSASKSFEQNYYVSIQLYKI